MFSSSQVKMENSSQVSVTERKQQLLLDEDVWPLRIDVARAKMPTHLLLTENVWSLKIRERSTMMPSSAQSSSDLRPTSQDPNATLSLPYVSQPLFPNIIFDDKLLELFPTSAVKYRSINERRCVKVLSFDKPQTTTPRQFQPIQPLKLRPLPEYQDNVVPPPLQRLRVEPCDESDAPASSDIPVQKSHKSKRKKGNRREFPNISHETEVVKVSKDPVSQNHFSVLQKKLIITYNVAQPRRSLRQKKVRKRYGQTEDEDDENDAPLAKISRSLPVVPTVVQAGPSSSRAGRRKSAVEGFSRSSASEDIPTPESVMESYNDEEDPEIDAPLAKSSRSLPVVSTVVQAGPSRSRGRPRKSKLEVPPPRANVDIPTPEPVKARKRKLLPVIQPVPVPGPVSPEREATPKPAPKKFGIVETILATTSGVSTRTTRRGPCRRPSLVINASSSGDRTETEEPVPVMRFRARSSRNIPVESEPEIPQETPKKARPSLLQKTIVEEEEVVPDPVESQGTSLDTPVQNTTKPVTFGERRSRRKQYKTFEEKQLSENRSVVVPEGGSFPEQERTAAPVESFEEAETPTMAEEVSVAEDPLMKEMELLQMESSQSTADESSGTPHRLVIDTDTQECLFDQEVIVQEDDIVSTEEINYPNIEEPVLPPPPVPDNVPIAAGEVPVPEDLPVREPLIRIQRRTPPKKRGRFLRMAEANQFLSASTEPVENAAVPVLVIDEVVHEVTVENTNNSTNYDLVSLPEPEDQTLPEITSAKCPAEGIVESVPVVDKCLAINAAVKEIERELADEKADSPPVVAQKPVAIPLREVVISLERLPEEQIEEVRRSVEERTQELNLERVTEQVDKAVRKSPARKEDSRHSRDERRRSQKSEKSHRKPSHAEASVPVADSVNNKTTTNRSKKESESDRRQERDENENKAEKKIRHKMSASPDKIRLTENNRRDQDKKSSEKSRTSSEKREETDTKTEKKKTERSDKHEKKHERADKNKSGKDEKREKSARQKERDVKKDSDKLSKVREEKNFSEKFDKLYIERQSKREKKARESQERRKSSHLEEDIRDQPKSIPESSQRKEKRTKDKEEKNIKEPSVGSAVTPSSVNRPVTPASASRPRPLHRHPSTPATPAPSKDGEFRNITQVVNIFGSLEKPIIRKLKKKDKAPVKKIQVIPSIFN